MVENLNMWTIWKRSICENYLKNYNWDDCIGNADTLSHILINTYYILNPL